MKTAERYTKHLEQMCGPLNERTKYAAVMLFREALNEPAAELEAQHRKTWALAMRMAPARALDCCISDMGSLTPTQAAYAGLQIAAGAISALPCPPIEATKDK